MSKFILTFINEDAVMRTFAIEADNFDANIINSCTDFRHMTYTEDDNIYYITAMCLGCSYDWDNAYTSYKWTDSEVAYGDKVSGVFVQTIYL